jgi:hypothetical protein
MMKKLYAIALCLAAWGLSLGAAAQVAQPAAPATTSFRYATGPITGFAVGLTDWVTLNGSTTKEVTITAISLCGTATAPATLDILLIKRSALDTGGGSASRTAANLTGNNVAATSVFAVYTANPTAVGTAAGNVDVKKLNVGPPGTAGCLNLEYGTRGAAPVILRGPASNLAINFNGVTVPAGLSLNAMVEVIEQ